MAEKKYSKKAVVSDTFDFPPELVWGEIIGHQTMEVAPLAEDFDFDNSDPGLNAMYTRLVERRENECISMDMKAHFNVTHFTVELEQLGECETRVTVTETVDYNDFRSFMMCKFGAGVHAEAQYYIRDLNKKLNLLMDKYKRDKYKNRS